MCLVASILASAIPVGSLSVGPRDFSVRARMVFCPFGSCLVVDTCTIAHFVRRMDINDIVDWFLLLIFVRMLSWGRISAVSQMVDLVHPNEVRTYGEEKVWGSSMLWLVPFLVFSSKVFTAFSVMELVSLVELSICGVPQDLIFLLDPSIASCYLAYFFCECVKSWVPKYMTTGPLGSKTWALCSCLL